MSMMGFRLWIKNDRVQRKALWVNGFVYALGRQNVNGVAVHASVFFDMPFPLAVEKYPYL